MQQRVYQMMFRNVYGFKKQTGEVWIGLEQNIINTAVNEWKSISVSVFAQRANISINSTAGS